MNLRFLKKYGKYESGDVLKDVFTTDGQKLIADGYAEQVLETPHVFVKHDWKAEHAKQAAAITPPIKKTNSPGTGKAGEKPTEAEPKNEQQ